MAFTEGFGGGRLYHPVDVTAQWFRPQSSVNETLVAAASPKFRTQQALTPPVNLTGRLFPTGNPSPSPSPATSGPFPLNPVPTTAHLPAPVAASPSPAAAPAKGSDTALYGLLALIAIPIGVALVAAALCLRSGSPASDPLPPMLDPMPRLQPTPAPRRQPPGTPSTPVGYMAQPGSAAYSDYPKPTPTGADAYPLGPGPYP
jgi:hypothetical protein